VAGIGAGRQKFTGRSDGAQAGPGGAEHGGGVGDVGRAQACGCLLQEVLDRTAVVVDVAGGLGVTLAGTAAWRGSWPCGHGCWS
jgi:hypothetical protein